MLHRLVRAPVLAAVVALGVVTLTLSRSTTAQPCNRQCEASRRDASGCCPSSPPPAAAPPAPPPPGARSGEKCATSRECAGALVCIDYRCQPPPPPSPPPPSPPPTVAPSPPTRPFDRGAAAAALGAIADAVGSCAQAGGPTGDGHASITFAPSGSVVMAIVDQPPFAGTAVGGCVAGRFRGARIPAFDGVNLTIGKRFTVAAGAPVAPDPPRR